MLHILYVLSIHSDFEQALGWIPTWASRDSRTVSSSFFGLGHSITHSLCYEISSKVRDAQPLIQFSFKGLTIPVKEWQVYIISGLPAAEVTELCIVRMSSRFQSPIFLFRIRIRIWVRLALHCLPGLDWVNFPPLGAPYLTRAPQQDHNSIKSAFCPPLPKDVETSLSRQLLT